MVNHECMHRQYSIKPLYMSLVSLAFRLSESLSTSESSMLGSDYLQERSSVVNRSARLHGVNSATL